MPKWFAIAAYRCEINGSPVGDLDIRVLGFEQEFEDQVRSSILDQPTHSYSNDLGETVSWPLAEILAIEEYVVQDNGGEFIGFIASPQQFQSWAHPQAT